MSALAQRFGFALAVLGASVLFACERGRESVDLHARHRRPDGSPRYTNRLVGERSPYLRQHAHNPVDWYPWGDEAFTRAEREGKLILLSIGYATCHWCHVMEEESFEDEEIAAEMNADYVAIKVDREERPDVDATYLQAIALLGGGGGWPMTVWLTPERQVFFAGTYFPPRDGARGVRLGFLSLLRHFAEAYRDHPSDIVANGRSLTARVHAASDVEPASETPGRAILDAAFRQYESAFDSEHGGFGRAPKFPMPSALDFLMRYHRRTGEAKALEMVQRTLAALAAGGVRDQLGGGFHRYATDPAWQIPHFEKMLYDNAQLASSYLTVAQATGNAAWREVAREILDDMLRTLRAPEGAFYGAVDADDPKGEGIYYTWTPAEIDAALSPQQSAAIRSYYGVESEGNFAGRSVLHVAHDWLEVAEELGLDVTRTSALVAAARARLLAARTTRPAPLVDTKILTAWNGLAISAYARAGVILSEPRYVDVAVDAATFVLAHLESNGRWLRVYAERQAGQAAFLDDYAFLAAAMIDLFEATSDLHWLEVATRLQATLDQNFWDDDRGGFFETGSERDAGLPRMKTRGDGAVPSGNAVAADNLVRLATLLDDARMRERAAACVRAFGHDIEVAPTNAPRLLGVIEALLDHPREIVLVEPAGGGRETAALLRVVHDRYLPNRALVVTRAGTALAAVRKALPYVGEKEAIDGRTTAYVCEHGRCLAPTSDPSVLGHQLDAVMPLPVDD